MASSTGSTSNLQISVEPSQSSFFAGEDFSCVITFTNTLVPVPQSVPLPSTATFEAKDYDRRVVSLGPKAFQDGYHSQQSNLQPLPNSPHPAGAPRRKHNKSQSVDVRTFARQNQLQPLDSGEGRGDIGGASTAAGGEDEVGGDEKYYKSVAEERERETEEDRGLYLQREVLENLPSRRRLIGKALDDDSLDAVGTRLESVVQLQTPPSKRHHQKAYSVAVPGQYMNQQQGLGMGRPAGGAMFSDSPRHPSQHVLLDASTPSPMTSRNPSSSLRQPSGPIASNHPHSRKKSVAQVQAEDLSAAFELEGTGSTGTENTPTQSLSGTPRGSLDLRTRGNESSQNFYGLGENSTMESVLREDVTQWSRLGVDGIQRGRSDSAASLTSTSPGLGQKRPANGTPLTPLFDSKAPGVPGTETLLWTFAQFGGSFQIDESLIKPGEFEQVKEKLAGRGAGMVGMISGQLPFSPVGGGELGAAMDAGAGTGDQRNAEGWGSYLRGVLSGGGGSRNRSLGAGVHRRAASTLGDMRTKTLASKSIPIFSNPPSMLAVDVHLAPGESRSYTFRIPLPPDLPPSYTGRAISFAYTLTLGTNRLARTKRGTVEQKSRLVRIPLRVYNLVSITGITSFFDLTNPIVNLKDLAESKEEGGEVQVLHSGRAAAAAAKESGRRESRAREDASAVDLLAYTRQLMASCKGEDEEEDDVPTDVEVATELARKQGITKHAATSPILRPHLQLVPDPIAIRHGDRLHSKAGLGLSVEEDDMPKSSLQAVEVLSRNSQKVSYDISKDGQVAAVLTLIKSKYRLGDTVNGVVTINGAAAIARVVRIAATLETHEEIESTLSTLPQARAQKMTRKVHAEYHENTLDLGQVCFSLPIPSGATPDFVTSAVRLAWTIRLSFLMLSSVRTGKEQDKGRPSPPAHLVPSIDDGYSTYHCAYRAAPALAGPTAAGGGADVGKEAKLEVVECAVPLTVLAHSTRFTVGEVAFMA